MEKAAQSKNINTSIADIKKKLGLDKIPVIHPPIKIKKDGKHLYKAAGFTYPLKPETIERLKIPSQKILYEVDRDEWHRELNEARENQGEKIDPELYPFGYED